AWSSAFLSSTLALSSPALSASPESFFLVQAGATSNEAVSNKVEYPRVRIAGTLPKARRLVIHPSVPGNARHKCQVGSQRDLRLQRVDVVHAGRRGELHVAARGLDLDALGHALEILGGLPLALVEQRLDLVGGALGLVV